MGSGSPGLGVGLVTNCSMRRHACFTLEPTPLLLAPGIAAIGEEVVFLERDSEDRQPGLIVGV